MYWQWPPYVLYMFSRCLLLLSPNHLLTMVLHIDEWSVVVANDVKRFWTGYRPFEWVSKYIKIHLAWIPNSNESEWRRKGKCVKLSKGIHGRFCEIDVIDIGSARQNCNWFPYCTWLWNFGKPVKKPVLKWSAAVESQARVSSETSEY